MHLVRPQIRFFICPATVTFRPFSRLLLRYLKLTGKLTARIFSSQTSLVYLDLSRNYFEGELPLAWFLPFWAKDPESNDGLVDRGNDSSDTKQGKPSRLSYFNVSRNQLTGSIPAGIRQLTALDTLDISYNKLEGIVPIDIGNCISLRVLCLSRCGLSGRIYGIDLEKEGDNRLGEDSGGVGRLTKLETLRLDGNILEGSVPAELGKLSRLQVLQLQVFHGLGDILTEASIENKIEVLSEFLACHKRSEHTGKHSRLQEAENCE